MRDKFWDTANLQYIVVHTTFISENFALLAVISTSYKNSLKHFARMFNQAIIFKET